MRSDDHPTGYDVHLRRIATGLYALTAELLALVDELEQGCRVLQPVQELPGHTQDANPIRCGADERLTFELLVEWCCYRIRKGLKRTMDELGQDLGVDRSTVYRRLKERGIDWLQAKRTAEARMVKSEDGLSGGR
jgi:hypothetical protein